MTCTDKDGGEAEVTNDVENEVSKFLYTLLFPRGPKILTLYFLVFIFCLVKIFNIGSV